ncbi:MAG TPA: corrinoid protein [Candidatus Eremiobacteraeota bacterium]|nr:MAG: Methionine synthase [bacterium ADurb.Bin363]HPZ07064.1 corrinoid protein [Candidatus Eremiobacteraeota bacterium]
MGELFQQMMTSVINGETEGAEKLAKEAISKGLSPLDCINHGFVAGLNYVGEQFSIGEMFVPDLVLASEVMKSAIAILEPEIVKQGVKRESLGKIVLGTVEGDIHDIGKSLVGTMLSASGFQVYDLGVDVSVESFVEKAREVNAHIVGLSTLLTTTMYRQKEVIDRLTSLGLRPGVKVIIGGAPVTGSWAEEIGADGYSEDAMGAVNLAKKLLGG